MSDHMIDERHALIEAARSVVVPWLDRAFMYASGDFDKDHPAYKAVHQMRWLHLSGDLGPTLGKVVDAILAEQVTQRIRKTATN